MSRVAADIEQGKYLCTIEVFVCLTFVLLNIFFHLIVFRLFLLWPRPRQSMLLVNKVEGNNMFAYSLQAKVSIVIIN